MAAILHHAVAPIGDAGGRVTRVGFCFKVKQDRIAEYRERHQSVWPDMLEALRATGWHNYSLFLRDDGLIFGYLETEDFQRALAGMAEREVNLRWQRDMAPFFEGLDGRRPDQGMLQLEEVFHLD
jgi:L-rhamnose mutarotase